MFSLNGPAESPIASGTLCVDDVSSIYGLCNICIKKINSAREISHLGASARHSVANGPISVKQMVRQAAQFISKVAPDIVCVEPIGKASTLGPINFLAVALANKLVRIAWSVLAHGRTFETSKIQTA